MIGCIDGTSITVRKPVKKIKSTYTNRHDTACLTLQAICDHKKRFIDIFTGIPGKVHDARVFKMSDTSKDLPTSKTCVNGHPFIPATFVIGQLEANKNLLYRKSRI